MLAAEESQRRKETFQKIYSWLKQKSKKIYYEKGGFLKRPRIIAELKPEMELERVEVTTFTVHHGYYTGTHYASHARTYLRILGTSEEGTFVNITIRDEGLFDKLAIGLGLTKDIDSGDPIFDQTHRIKSGTPEIALKLLKDKQFRDYVSMIRDLRKFEIRGGKHLHFIVECNYDVSSAVNAILAMERTAEVLAPEIERKPVKVEKARPVTPKVEPRRAVSSEVTLKLKKEFEKLSISVSKLEFKPSEENFTRVIITPLLGEFDYVQYEITEKLKVRALDNLEKPASKTITIQIYPKDMKTTSTQKPTSIEEIKTLFDIRCEDQEVLRRISEAYILFEVLSEIKELSNFNVKLQGQTMEIYLECGLNPENIRRAYEVIREAAWWTKFYILI